MDPETGAAGIEQPPQQTSASRSIWSEWKLSDTMSSRNGDLSRESARTLVRFWRRRVRLPFIQRPIRVVSVLVGLLTVGFVVSLIVSPNETTVPSQDDSSANGGLAAPGEKLPRIWLTLPAFRDSLQCSRTIRNAFASATQPSRVRLAIYDQLDHDEDVPIVARAFSNCNADGEGSKTQNAQLLESEEEKKKRLEYFESRPVPEVDWDANIFTLPLGGQHRGQGRGVRDNDRTHCQYRHNVHALEVAARGAPGVVAARFMAEQIVLSQEDFDPDFDFVLQLDAHTEFSDDWDTRLIAQWQMIGREKAILTAYPLQSRYKPEPTGPHVPLLCGANFDGHEGKGGLPTTVGTMWHARDVPDAITFEIDGKLVKGDAVKKLKPEQTTLRNWRPGMPVRHPCFAAGFSFARAHRIVEVPNDPQAVMLYFGEELSMAIRLFTAGYDTFAPTDGVVFHLYASNAPTRKFLPWNEHKQKLRDESALRIHAIFQEDWALAKNPLSPKPGDRFGLGTVRPVEQYWEWASVDMVKKETSNLCTQVGKRNFGEPLHKLN
ncbi:MAG: hypothetical protein MHM6MM_006497 [Cercozoa sp. M6MM]